MYSLVLEYWHSVMVPEIKNLCYKATAKDKVRSKCSFIPVNQMNVQMDAFQKK